MDVSFWLVVVVITGVAIATVLLHKLTAFAALIGVVIAVLIFKAFGCTGLAMLATFFILGTAATSFKLQQKQQLKLAEENKGKRNAAQVLANAGVAALLGLATWLFPTYQMMLVVMMAAAFAAATADTLSSELGNIYGKKYYNIITLKKDSRGLNGVISLEGTLFGLAGSILIAIIYAIGFGWGKGVVAIIIAGTAGNIFDSLFGATAERKGMMGNNTVNFLNTLIAAFTAAAIMLLHC